MGAAAHPMAARVPGAAPAPMMVRASSPPSAMPWRPAIIRRIGRGDAGKHPDNKQSGELTHGFLHSVSPPSRPAAPRVRRRGNARRRYREWRGREGSDRAFRSRSGGMLRHLGWLRPSSRVRCRGAGACWPALVAALRARGARAPRDPYRNRAFPMLRFPRQGHEI